MKYMWKKCYKKFFGHIFWGACTIQMVPKYIRMQHCKLKEHCHLWPAPPPKKFDQLLIFVNLYQHAKNQFIPSVHSSDTVNFKVPSHDWPHPFLTMPTPKTFKLIFMKLYQHAKNKLIPLVNLILESSNQICLINMLKMRLFHQFAWEK